MSDQKAECSCIKGEAQAFDFVVSTYDCRSLILTDTSNWMLNDGYTIPSLQLVTITLPNSSTVDVNMNAGSVTSIKASELLGGECIVDGIYKFSTVSCGEKYTRHKAVVCTLTCKLDNYISKANTQEDWDNISNLSSSIHMIQVNAEMGLEYEAKKLFSIVNKELDKHSCTCYCR